jgi:hypothetical protein
VKTTSSETDVELFKHTMQQYGYALSAALYCEMARVNYAADHDFYFIVLSKADQGCAVYKTSLDTLAHGEAEYIKAIHKYKKHLLTGDWSNNNKSNIIFDDILEV